MREKETKAPITEEELIETLLDFLICAASFAKKAYLFAKNRQPKELRGDGHE